MELAQEAQTLSRILNTRALYYAISDTTNYLGYEFFDRGVSLERLEEDENGDLILESQLRQITNQNRVSLSSSEAFDTFLREQDIYIPHLFWSEFPPGQPAIVEIRGFLPEQEEAGSSYEPTEAEVFDRSHFERVDYLAL